MLRQSLGEAVDMAYQTAIEQLDRQSAQIVLESGKKVKREVAETVVEIMNRHTASDKYKDEEGKLHPDLSPNLQDSTGGSTGHRVAQAVSQFGRLQ